MFWRKSLSQTLTELLPDELVTGDDRSVVKVVRPSLDPTVDGLKAFRDDIHNELFGYDPSVLRSYIHTDGNGSRYVVEVR